MGAFLDSAENIRQGQKGSPWQAYCQEEKLEKNKDSRVRIMEGYNSRVPKFTGLPNLVHTPLGPPKEGKSPVPKRQEIITYLDI